MRYSNHKYNHAIVSSSDCISVGRIKVVDGAITHKDIDETMFKELTMFMKNLCCNIEPCFLKSLQTGGNTLISTSVNNCRVRGRITTCCNEGYQLLLIDIHSCECPDMDEFLEQYKINQEKSSFRFPRDGKKTKPKVSSSSK